MIVSILQRHAGAVPPALLLFFSATAAVVSARADTADLFAERVASVVAVEYYIESETDRRPASEVGVVADGDGLILLLDRSVPGWVPPVRLKEFKVSTLGKREEFSAEYLGQDSLSGFHFLRVAEEGRDGLVPVTNWEPGDPRLGGDLFGIGVMGKEVDFEPYYLASRFSMLRELPQHLGFAVEPVASPGSLVFLADGRLAGWATGAYALEHMLHAGDDRFPVVLQEMRRTAVFLPHGEVLPYLDRVPASPDRLENAWIGVTSLQPVEREVARFLGLEGRGAVVVSEVVPGGPADEAGLKQGDIVVGIDGEELPRFRPDQAVVQYFQRAVTRAGAGAKLTVAHMRGDELLETVVETAPQPLTARDARREYLSKLGATFREFLVFDGMARREGPEPDRGAVVQFVRPHAPASSAGLQAGDWIREVDGREVVDFEETLAMLKEAEESAVRDELVLLVRRQSETSVVRINLR